MYAIVLVLNFFACCLFSLAFLRRHCSTDPRSEAYLREAIVVGCLLFSLESWFFAEGLSLFNALKTPEPMFALHLLSLLALSVGIVSWRETLSLAVRELREVNWDPFLFKLTLGIVALVLLPLLYISIYYPPCTADSMSYHLVRVLHWIQNGNVEMYPTNYPRQLYYQPFPEYLVLPWELLTGGDFFDNTVQLVALAVMLLQLSLLVRFFGGNGLCQFLAISLALASPIVIFEASTTQTDIILTVFYFSFLYFGFKLSRENATPTKPLWFLSIACLGVSLGLSLNTKLSVAAFEIPFCLWFGLRFLSLHGQRALTIFAGMILGFAVLNGPYFHRNAEISGSIFGPAEIQQRMRNLRFGIGPTFSNALRNITMQLRVPHQKINDMNLEFVLAVHDLFNLSIYDTDTTYTGDGTIAYEYETVFVLDDYRSGNIMIIVLFGITCITMLVHRIQGISDPTQTVRDETKSPPPPSAERKRKGDKGALAKVNRDEDAGTTIPELSLGLYTALMVAGFLIYSGLFRWQPFGARLLLPCFLGVIPYIVLGMNQFLPQARIALFSALLLAVGVLYTVFSLATTMFFDPTLALLRPDNRPVHAETLSTSTQVPSLSAIPSTETTVAGVRRDAPTVFSTTTLDIAALNSAVPNPAAPHSATSSTTDLATPNSLATEIERRISAQGAELWTEYFTPKENWWKTYLSQRNYKYFRLIHSYMLDYLSLGDRIDELGFTRIGIAFDRFYDRWEYPFWPILRSKGRNYRIEWEIYPDYLKKSVNYDPTFVPELLISDWPRHVVEKYFEIGRVWEYDLMVLYEIKGRKNAAPVGK